MNRVLHNYGLIHQESDSSDFENEMAELNVPIRKEKKFAERKNYFELLRRNRVSKTISFKETNCRYGPGRVT